MKIFYVLLVLIFVGINSYSQNIKTDIFDNLEYESKNGNYEAHLEDNIFDDLIFTDNNGNEISLKKKYLDLMYSDIFKDSDKKIDLFTRLISEHRHVKKYKVSYTVGFGDKIVIEDNGEEAIIDEGIRGELVYEFKNEEATLQKDIFNNWIYEDSRGNELKISSETWKGLIKRFGTKEKVLHHLTYELLKI
jgi:hypothetical protein